MSTLRSTPIRLVAILIALAAAVVLSTVAMTRDSGGSVTVTAFFRDSSPLTVGNEVRAAGVRVGEIRSIELQHGRARVEMDIEKAVLPLHRDAKATVTDKNLLGERFVDLQPGNPSAPAMGKPLELPVAQTDRVVDLQQVLNAVDDPTGTALSALLTTVGEGSEKQGPQIAEAIRALAPAMRHTDQLGRILGDQNQLLSQLVGNAQPVAGAMATDRGRKLDNLVGSAEQTMSTVSINYIYKL